MANPEGQALVLDYFKTRSDELQDKILLSYRPLIVGIAKKFSFNPSDIDDLIQVASISLLTSLDRFDPSKEVAFSTFATPNIIGEIKHYFRDKNRLVKIPRKLQETNSKIRNFIRSFQQTNEGLSPTIQEISDSLHISEEIVLESLEAYRSSQALSLDSTTTMKDFDSGDSPTLLDQISTESSEDFQLKKETLEQALQILTDKELQAVKLRFFGNLSQIEIAKRLDLSQMHVSRILKKALKRLHTYLSQEEF